MENIFFTTGPTQLFDTVRYHIDNAIKYYVCSISHRGKEFEDIFYNCTNALKRLLRMPNEYNIFFTSSSTETMELVIQNCVANHSFHFVNGAFSGRFFETAKELRKEPEKTEVPWGYGFDFGNVRIPNETEMICLTQNETSTGVAIELNDIYKLKEENPDRLIAIDAVSSTPYIDINQQWAKSPHVAWGI